LPDIAAVLCKGLQRIQARRGECCYKMSNDKEQEKTARRTSKTTSTRRAAERAKRDARTECIGVETSAVLAVIDELQGNLAQERDMRAAFDDMLERVVSLTESEFGFIGEVLSADDGHQFLKCYSMSQNVLRHLPPSRQASFVADGLEFHNLDALFGTTIKTDTFFISNNPAKEDGYEIPSGHPPVHAFLSLPLHFGRELVGMIGLANRPGGYGDAMVESLNALARTCGTIIGSMRVAAERQVAEEILREAIETIPEGFAVFSPEDRLMLSNGALGKVYRRTHSAIHQGISFEDMIRHGIAHSQVVDAGETEESREAWIQQRLEVHRQADHCFLQRLPDDRWVQVEERRAPSGRIVGLWTDVTEAKRTEAALRSSEEKFRSLYELAPTGIAMCSPDGRVIDGNQAFQKMLGRSKVDMHNVELEELVTAESWPAFKAEIDGGTESRLFGPVEIELVGKSGTPVSVIATGLLAMKGNNVDLTWLIVQDISERKHAATVVWRAENYDPLTNLPNRSYLNEFIRDLRGSGGREQEFGLLLVGLDNFKAINDVFGHVAGDAVIAQVGERLSRCIRDGDFIARLGGDEFALVIRGMTSRARLMRVADRILRALRRKIVYRGQPLYCQGSIGIASFPEHGLTAPELIRSADIALYNAKKNGRNRSFMFDVDLLRETEIRYEAVSFVRSALKNDRIVPAYQPKVCLKTGALVGFEALVRIRDTDGEINSPGSFIEAFDEPELLAEIDQRMLDLVTNDIRDWLDHGVDVGRIAVNASNSELWSGDYAERVLSMMRDKGLPKDRLQIEVTETAFLGSDFNSVAGTLEQLSDAGIAIALDDFGTGYASLTHLKTLPVSRVKIDRSFVFDLMTNRVSQAIVETIVKLCKELDKVVVAEGIETEEQLEMLKSFGCDRGQGFYFARPMLRDEVNLYILKSFAAKMRADWNRSVRKGFPAEVIEGGRRDIAR